MMNVEERTAGRHIQADLFAQDRVDLAALAGVEPGSGVEILGYLFWFTITELAITADELQACFARAGADVKHLPAPIRDCDAFRRATSQVERRKVETGTKGLFWNLLAREVKADKREVVRQLVLETVDGGNVRLSYEPMTELRLDRTAHVLDWMRLRTALAGHDTWAVADGAAQDAERLYGECMTHYNDRHIREVLQSLLGPGQTVCVRPSGGVYFIPHVHQDVLAVARALVKELDPYSTGGGRSRLYYVPVVDGSEQREMVEVSLEDQVNGELQRLTVEMADLLKSGRTVKTATAAAYVERIRAIGRQTETYRDLLRTDLVQLEAAIEAVRGQGMALLAAAE